MKTSRPAIKHTSMTEYTCKQFTLALLTQPFFLTGDVEGRVVALVDGGVVLVECVMCDNAIGLLRRIPEHRERVWVWNCTRRKNFLRSCERIDMKLIKCSYTENVKQVRMRFLCETHDVHITPTCGFSPSSCCHTTVYSVG